MYSLKPIVALPEQICHSAVMYQLPRIQGGEGGAKTGCISDNFLSDIGRQQPLPEINLLEHRQMRILQELAKLKGQLEFLSIAARVADVVKPDVSDLDLKIGMTPVEAEIIIHTNPASPPYSILALQRLWKDTNFKVQSFRHSTVSDDATFSSFEDKLISPRTNFANNIVVTLIWKDVRDVQLITKVQDFPFEGEISVLRYLTRLIEKYKYEDSKLLGDSNITDTILDLCSRLPREDPANVQDIINQFIGYLNKRAWFSNLTDQPSIVDVAVWSILKRTMPDDVPRELKRWFNLCEGRFLST